MRDVGSLGLVVQEDGLAEFSREDVGEQGWQVGWEEFVCAGRDFGFAPPMVTEESRFLVGGVPGSQGGRSVGDAGEVDGLAAVVFLASVAEAGLAVPEVGSEVVEEDAGFLGEFAASSVGQGPRRDQRRRRAAPTSDGRACGGLWRG